MEVVCGRCKADYEFDDALISARGTVVRCTNCGLQFKVFPPGGASAPEEWSVLSEDGAEVLATYATLPDLQRAIGLGEVNGDDLLVRGDESPRRLSEILELAPLLRQGASYRPPVASEHPPGVAPPAHPFNKTRIGLPSLSEVTAGLGGGGGHSPGAPDVDLRPRRPPEGRKIRSALSGPFLGVKVAPDPTPGTLPTGSPPGTSSRAYLPSLSATLASPVPPLPAAPNPPRPEVAVGQKARRPAGQSGTHARSDPPPSSSSRRTGSPPDQFGTTQPSASPGPRSEPPPSPRSKAMEVPVRVSEPGTAPSGEIITGVRSSGEPRRMARGALFVIAIFAGATIFLATLGRERLGRLLSPGPALTQVGPISEDPARATAGPDSAAVPVPKGASTGSTATQTAHVTAEARSLEVTWWRARLDPERAPTLASEVKAQAEELLSRLDAIDRDDDAGTREARIVLRVDILRMAGRHQDARRLVAELGALSAKYPYAIAMLDLSEGAGGLSMSAQIQELSRARLGQAPYLPESAVIYALASDGKIDEARMELGRLREQAGATPPPLGPSLESFLERSAVDKARETREAEEEVPAEDEERSAGQPARAGKAKPAPEQVQAWAREADSLWTGGNQKGAVVLYQKVKQALGTKHFLGQRAAARIQQAKREGTTR